MNNVIIALAIAALGGLVYVCTKTQEKEGSINPRRNDGLADYRWMKKRLEEKHRQVLIDINAKILASTGERKRMLQIERAAEIAAYENSLASLRAEYGVPA